jgi:hypothetical protein
MRSGGMVFGWVSWLDENCLVVGKGFGTFLVQN